MNNLVKRVLAIVLSAVVCIGAVVTPISTAFADEAYPALQAEKKAEETDHEKYEVSIQVPGGDAEVRHDEIILMVDGSYSMDNEWPAMKAAIIEIGKNVLDGSGHTLLTLMAFGMGDNMVLEHVVTVDELAAELGELPGNLLYGRSSTNCEAGFTGVAEYIEAHDDTLGEVQVVFISDGNINTDEHKEVFYFAETAWTKSFTLGGALTAALEDSVKVMKAYEEVVPSPAFVDVFGADADLDELLADIDEIVLERHKKYKIPISVNTDTEMYEKIVEWADKVYRNVFAAAGLDVMGENCVSDVERAFVTYDNENITYIQEAFYYVLMGRGYPDRFTRTPAAADALAAMDKVEALYLVDYDTASTWMSVDVKSEKAHFVNANGISGLIEALKDTLNALAKTPYNDVVITDYMSKWVKLDPTTLRIVDVTSDKVIWTAKDGWLIDSGRPTAKEVPVTVELVDPENYAAGGADVIGNTSGDIYLLTWYVKDGAMLRSDNYRLAYDVDVDVEEDGFEYNKFYPANGTTENTYKDETGAEKKVPIKVPEVISEIESTQIQIDGNKYLDGELSEKEFAFELWHNGQLVETVVNGTDGKFTFSDLIFDAEGTYEYIVKEFVNTEDVTINYDTREYKVTVVVTLDGLDCVADVSVEGGEIVFENTTVPKNPANVVIEGNKNLDGEPAEDEFTFELWYNGKLIETVVNGTDGKFTFRDLIFDAEGTYEYVVKEYIDPENDYIDFDESVYTIVINVTTEDGVNYAADVTITKTVDGEDESVNEIVFNNEYKDEDIPNPPPPKDPGEEPELGSTAETVWTFTLILAMLGIVVTTMKKRKVQE